jgi:hypothetical protein
MHIPRAWMIFQHAQQITTITGAHACHADFPGRKVIQRVGNPCAYDHQPPRKLG